VVAELVGFQFDRSGFQAVQGSWTIPDVNPLCGSDCCYEYSSMWVGLGCKEGCTAGSGDVLFQAGTESDNNTSNQFGKQYYAWWQRCCSIDAYQHR
jgi:hypothetical protein